MTPTTNKQTGVYVIRHDATGKLYVGSAANISGRFKQHQKARAGKRYEGEEAEELKIKKQAAWAERKAKGLHTRRWYMNRGLEIPSETSIELDNREV